MMRPEVTWGERILLALSRNPGADDYATPHDRRMLDNALSLLSAIFPDFLVSIRGRYILDFGCGSGLQALAMGRSGARYVFGLDANQQSVTEARELAAKLGLQSQVEFGATLAGEHGGRFDLVICQNSMEHFPDPARALEVMKSTLGAQGKIMITFGPPWYAPYGSHMHFFTKVPWVNILFGEKTVMRVRSHFRQDGALSYVEVEGGLNKMSIATFEGLIRSHGMRLDWHRYDCVKRLDWLAHIPVLRELFINRISCVLST